MIERIGEISPIRFCIMIKKAISMNGAIIGDVIGSRFEGYGKRPLFGTFRFFTDENVFTDDTVLTVAVADAILYNRDNPDYKTFLKEYYSLYPNCRYGKKFREWNCTENSVGDSYGNGSIMRVSPIVWAYNDLDKMLAEGKRLTETTHNHEWSLKSVDILIKIMHGLKKTKSKGIIIDVLKENGIDILKPSQYVYEFDLSSLKTLEQACSCVYFSSSFKESIKKAVKIGGDSDTIASVAGAMSEFLYQIPHDIIDKTWRKLDGRIKMVAHEFNILKVNQGENVWAI